MQFLVSFSLGLFLCSGCVPCSSSAHRAPGEKAAVIYKVLARPGREANSRPTNTGADAPYRIVRYGGLLLALYYYNGLVAPGLSLYSGFIFTRFVLCSGCVHCSSSAHRAPGKKATVPIYSCLNCQLMTKLETKHILQVQVCDCITTKKQTGNQRCIIKSAKSSTLKLNSFEIWLRKSIKRS